MILLKLSSIYIIKFFIVQYYLNCEILKNCDIVILNCYYCIIYCININLIKIMLFKILTTKPKISLISYINIKECFIFY